VNPDGTDERLVFDRTACDASCEGELYADSDGGADPTWSPDGKRIAFICADASSRALICVINADGAVQQILPVVSGFYGPSQPTWSPDGSCLAYTYPDPPSTGEPGRWHIGTRRADDSSAPCPYVEQADLSSDPAWSPDGERIAFQGLDEIYDPGQEFPSRHNDLYVGVVDNGPPTQLTYTDNARFEGAPAWSPDGQKVAFFSGQPLGPGPTQLYTINPDGTGETLLRGGSDPAWSPDGRKIAYVGSSLGPFGIYTMNSDGSNPQLVVADGSSPDWQPLHALDQYARPGSGGPIEVRFVPAYRPCTAPNSQHVPPMVLPSCGPPVLQSNLLTTSSAGKGYGALLLKALRGDPSTTADEADGDITAAITDVRCRAAGTPGCAAAGDDYVGKLLITLAGLRITDRANGYGGLPGTVQSTRFSIPIDCAATNNPSLGSRCSLSTSLDTLVPDFVKEEKRSIFSIPRIYVEDAGADGVATHSGCPPTCGTGDENTYLEGGLFTP
jgi:hypothetical protein